MGGWRASPAGFFWRLTDRIVGRIADTIMAFPLFVLCDGDRRALGNTVENIILATAIVNFRSMPASPGRANVRREAGLRDGGAAVRQR